tara:strand:+ start:2105 stop:2449 length:345 start_codon:yes stop_codon:yes gene_type:complete
VVDDLIYFCFHARLKERTRKMNKITIHHQDGEYDVTAQQDHTPDRDANMSWTFSEFTAARDFASNYLSLMNTTSESWQLRSSQNGFDGCGLSAIPKLKVVKQNKFSDEEISRQL